MDQGWEELAVRWWCGSGVGRLHWVVKPKPPFTEASEMGMLRNLLHSVQASVYGQNWKKQRWRSQATDNEEPCKPY